MNEKLKISTYTNILRYTYFTIFSSVIIKNFNYINKVTDKIKKL